MTDEISKLDTEDAGMMQESMKEMIEMMDGMDMQPEDFDKMQNMVVCNGMKKILVIIKIGKHF